MQCLFLTSKGVDVPAGAEDCLREFRGVLVMLAGLRNWWLYCWVGVSVFGL